MKICNQALLTGLSLKLVPPVSCAGTLRKPGLPATNLIETKSKLMTVRFFFHILVLQEYWVLTESRITLKPVLVGMTIVALSISAHEQTQ